MKPIIKNSFFTLLTAGAVSLMACNESGKGTGSGDSTGNTSTVSADTTGGAMKNNDGAMTSTDNKGSNSAEQDFINYVVKANAEEMTWLKAGIQNGTSKELKDHAKMMLKDHEKMGTEVKDYLSKTTTVTAPALDTMNVVDLKEAKGADWDKAFTNKMVDAHEDLLDKLKTAQKDVKDAQLLTIVNGAIPVVQSHYDMVKGMKDKMK